MTATTYADHVTLVAIHPDLGGTDGTAAFAASSALDELADMATAGYEWEMFSAAGNAACSGALASVLARGDELTVDTLVPVFSAAIRQVAVAGHTEVGDTEPEVRFEHAANLVATVCDWPKVSRFDFNAHHTVIDDAQAAKREGTAAAVAALIDRHRDEYNQLVVAEIAKRTP